MTNKFTWSEAMLTIIAVVVLIALIWGWNLDF